jgi:hypothetical protein
MPLSRLTRRPVLTAAFVLAVAVTVFFAVRLVLFTLFWADPTHREQPIEGWMSPGYVAHSWDLPREKVAGSLDLEPRTDGRRLTLDEIAEERGVPVADLIATLEAMIAAHRADRP